MFHFLWYSYNKADQMTQMADTFLQSGQEVLAVKQNRPKANLSKGKGIYPF